jgi:hypothetical protein
MRGELDPMSAAPSPAPALASRTHGTSVALTFATMTSTSTNPDLRIAEWLSEDPRFEVDEPPDRAQSLAPDAPPVRPSDRAPAGAARSVALQRAKHRPVPLGVFGGPEARVLELVAELGRRIRRRPLTALAVAAGAGFIVGGALTFKAGRLLLAAGVRHVTRELLKQLL